MSTNDFDEPNETTEVVDDIHRVDDNPASAPQPDTSTTAASAAASAAAAAAADHAAIVEEEHLRGPRVPTIVWGLLVMATGALLITWGLGIDFNFGSTAAIALGIAGGALVVAALLPARRK